MDLVDVVAVADVVPYVIQPWMQDAMDNATAASASAATATTKAGEAAASAASIVRGGANGVAPLDAGSKVPDANLPTRLGASELSTTFVAKWAASTAYSTGAQVVSPLGVVVAAKATFTSASTYSAADWDLPVEFVAKVDRVAADQLYEQSYNPDMLNGYAAVANWENAPARLLFIGDSLTYGFNSTSFPQRFASVAARALRTRLGNAPGAEFIAAGREATSAIPDLWTYSGTVPTNSSFGIARQSVILNTVGQSMTTTVTGSTMDVWFVKEQPGGTLNVTVDGGAATAIDATRVAAGWQDGYFTTIALGADAAHSVTVSYASGTGRVDFCGLDVYNATTAVKGVRSYVMGRYGYTTSNYGMDTSNFGSAVKTLNPHAIVYFLGVNDYSNGIAPDTTKTNVLANLAYIRANTTSKPSILLIVSHLRSGTYTYPWSDYAAKLREIAAAASDVSLLDLSVRMPSVDSDTLGLYSDSVHYSNKGHALVGSMIAQALLPR
jgi:hypothetical protein